MTIKRLFKLLKDKSGVTAIEYGLIAALVGVAIIGGVTALGGSLNTMFTDVSTTVGGSLPTSGDSTTDTTTDTSTDTTTDTSTTG